MESKDINWYKQKVEETGLKATHQRIVIYKAMMEMGGHPSVEDIYEYLRALYPSLSLGTIYRTLDSLVQSGVLQRASNREGKLLFDANIERHHHLCDGKAKRMVDFMDPELNKLIENHFKAHPPKDFKITDFQLRIEGTFAE